jgi:putative endonuclease
MERSHSGLAPKGTPWVALAIRARKTVKRFYFCIQVIMYYLYILQSQNFNRFYIGVTEDIQRRLKKHNKGSTKSTKLYKPWKIIYSEKYLDKNLVYKREFYLKHPEGYLEKIKIINNNRTFGEIA